jgi:hypothetical protein
MLLPAQLLQAPPPRVPVPVQALTLLLPAVPMLLPLARCPAYACRAWAAAAACEPRLRAAAPPPAAALQRHACAWAAAVAKAGW